MSPWLSVALLGVAVSGYAWFAPRRSPADGEGGSDPVYDRLLEELESENRELLDAVTKFKQEQDGTVNRLVKQIVELERQMKSLAEQSAAAAAVRPAAAAAETVATAEPAPEAAPGSRKKASRPKAAAPDPQPEPSPPPAYDPASVHVRYADLLALHGKGRSVEQIAKSVGMNKGEVQLILQLARREEDQHA